jgi:DNA topoisomerase-1
VAELYGEAYLPEKARVYVRKAKGAQEAHEAIRPAGDSFRTPRSLAGQLEQDALRLYELVWKRTVASQMKDATGMRTTVLVHADAGAHGKAVFTASGKVISFPGFLRAYVEGSDDPKAELADQEKLLPPLRKDQKVDPVRVDPSQHQTQPPPRYTEASLIKELEERAIGRPSTYAAIIQTIQDRGYVRSKGAALIPTFTAFAVVNLLEQYLGVLVDYDFTARMEDGLDAIASGKREPVPWLREFYFGETNGDENHGNVTGRGLKALILTSVEEIDARAVSRILIGVTKKGDEVAVRVGRYGPYVQIGDSDQRATVSDDIPPDEFSVERALELIEKAELGDRILGTDPETSKPVYIKTGRFGPYVQLGDPELTEKGKIKRGGKPKMASIWPSMSVETLTLEEALMLLSFPREVGVHPEKGQVITAQDGRFGPYLKMGEDSRSLPDHEKLRSITLAEAVEIYKQPKGRGRRSGAAVIAELGKHPESGGLITVKTGRYGPYVTDGVVNATLPKGKEPGQVSLEEAIELITAKENKLRDQGKDPRAAGKKKKGSKKTGKKAARKKTTKKTTDS